MTITAIRDGDIQTEGWFRTTKVHKKNMLLSPLSSWCLTRNGSADGIVFATFLLLVRRLLGDMNNCVADLAREITRYAVALYILVINVSYGKTFSSSRIKVGLTKAKVKFHLKHTFAGGDTV